MTIDQTDELLVGAITQAVRDCKEDKITTTEMVARIEEIIDCGKAVDEQRQLKNDEL